MNTKTTLACIFLTAMLTLSFSTIALATSNSVNPPIIRVIPDFSTIQEAINNATPGSIIDVANGTYNEALVINKSITLIGQGAGKTILNGTIAATGIQITADNVTIQGFSIQGYRTDMIINQSRNVFITESQISRSLTLGATYIIASTNVTMTKSTVANSDCPGVAIYNSTTTRFSENTITHNQGVGLFLENTTDHVAKDNLIESNGGDAICAFYGSDMYVEGNTLALSGYRGIWATESSGKVFHNNFLRNHENARSIFSNFTWDDGYPSGGNYWSNYTGDDSYYGSNQSITGSDGIGDVPYSIPDQGEQDRYPLMGNFTKQQVTLTNQTYLIEFDSNAQPRDSVLNQTGKNLTFHIASPNQTEGFLRIAIPKALMWSNASNGWLVTMDGNLTQTGINEDNNQTYIYFTIRTGSYTVKISSSNIVPESLSPLTLVLLTTAVVALALATVYERHRLRKAHPIHGNLHPHVKNGHGATGNY